MYYINFYFQDLVYDEKSIAGKFLSKDDDVSCSFLYDRSNGKCDIWDNNKPVEEITPLPIHWLLYKLEKEGRLKEKESKISY